MTTSNWLGHTRDKRYSSQRWLKLRKSILAGSPRCDLCGHFGANSLDHTIPVEQLPGELFYARENLKPMHDHRSPCQVCSVASEGKIQGACQQVKGSHPLDVAKARLKRRTGLAWGEMPKTTRTTAAGTAQKGQTTPAPEFPYATVQEAMRDLQPFSKGSEDYALVVRMINDSAMCERSCVCGGGVGGGRCIDSLDELDQRTI